MNDFLDKLANDAINRLDKGYYDLNITVKKLPVSLTKNISRCKNAPIIAEIKFSSPSKGIIKENTKVGPIASIMQRGGAIGLSILTEPDNFDGSIYFLPEVRANTTLPILMKDIILSTKQIDAASKVGANAVLLISTLFHRNYCEKSLPETIRYAHSKNLEVLLETHTLDEFMKAMLSEAEIVGINNRNLKTLKVDLNVTRKILQKARINRKPVVSESGIEEPQHVNFLHSFGVKSFLVGTSIMTAANIEEKIRELVMSYANKS